MTGKEGSDTNWRAAPHWMPIQRGVMTNCAQDVQSSASSCTSRQSSPAWAAPSREARFELWTAISRGFDSRIITGIITVLYLKPGLSRAGAAHPRLPRPPLQDQDDCDSCGAVGVGRLRPSDGGCGGSCGAEGEALGAGSHSLSSRSAVVAGRGCGVREMAAPLAHVDHLTATHTHIHVYATAPAGAGGCGPAAVEQVRARARGERSTTCLLGSAPRSHGAILINPHMIG